MKYLIIGAGDRGQMYGRYSERYPGEAEVVGVAEPREHQRQLVADKYGLPSARVFKDWREAAAVPRFADAVIIATQDQDHTEPALAFAACGYHILLEKPMATSADECRRIVAAAEKFDVIFAVGHVLRYTPYFSKLKELLNEGVVGEVVNIQHCEPVGFWHMAHSFVRGNWRNQKESSFMLLAKSCHDLDVLRWLMAEPCRRVSSFGSLSHFLPANKPSGASDRCLECGVERSCPYSARRLYHRLRESGRHGWPLHVVTNDFTEEGVNAALNSGPYGRCVYSCDNDVVDHQVVNLEFDSGRTANFLMTAFSHDDAARTTRIFGTHGEIRGDSRVISVHRFGEENPVVIDTGELIKDADSGHGGGDFGLMEAFVKAVSIGDRSHILSGPQETLESHLMVFAAEESRMSGQTVLVNSCM